jgi:hypothetical protein
MLRCMTRTQVYLTDDQRSRIDELMRARGVTLAEVVRQALDRYLAEEVPDRTRALDETFGIDSEAAVPDRNEWARG